MAEVVGGPEDPVGSPNTGLSLVLVQRPVSVQTEVVWSWKQMDLLW